jgi:hypothetical protein
LDKFYEGSPYDIYYMARYNIYIHTKVLPNTHDIDEAMSLESIKVMELLVHVMRPYSVVVVGARAISHPRGEKKLRRGDVQFGYQSFAGRVTKISFIE